MMNGSMIYKLQVQQESQKPEDPLHDQKHSSKNNKLAQNYYSRVSNFAKEMLVEPAALIVHKQTQELHPVFSTRSLAVQPFRQEQPMLFGGYKTGTERLVQQIVVNNQSIDTTPSKLQDFGNDSALLNLRPEETEKHVGRSGRFRQKGVSGEQRFLDRLTQFTPIYLPQDKATNRAVSYQLAESDVKARQARIALLKLDEFETVIKSNKPHVPFPDLHKKTYFNALQTMLTTPQPAPVNQSEINPKTWGSAKILEDSIKHPPQSYQKILHKITKSDREWYDNLIDPENMIIKKTRNQDQRELSGKTQPSAILNQVLRQCGHSQRAPQKTDNFDKAQLIQKLTKEIHDYGSSIKLAPRKGSQTSLGSHSVLKIKASTINLPSSTRNVFINSSSIQQL